MINNKRFFVLANLQKNQALLSSKWLNERPLHFEWAKKKNVSEKKVENKKRKFS